MSSATTSGRVECGDPNSASALSLRDSVVEVVSSPDMVNVIRCTLQITSSKLIMDGTSVGGAITLNTDTSFEGDRLQIRSINSNQGLLALSMFGERVSVRLTNSLLEDAGINLVTADTVAPGSQLFFAFNTFTFSTNVGDGRGQLNCNGNATPKTVLFENNIITAFGEPEAVIGDRCTFRNNVISPLTTALPNNTIADPQFVDAAARNFRLKSTSPAVDTAMPSATLDTDHDIEGTARPQGVKSDIGAFELKP